MIRHLGQLLLGAGAATAMFFAHAAPAAAAPAQPVVAQAAYEQGLVDAINADRAAVGLPKLVVDPRLTAIARRRDEYQIQHGFFSHCVDGAASCPTGRLHFYVLMQQAGFPSMWEAENLAANSDDSPTLVSEMNTDWLASPHHHEQIVNPIYNVTGIGVVCCGTLPNANGQMVSGVAYAAEIFAQYPPDMLAALPTGTGRDRA